MTGRRHHRCAHGRVSSAEGHCGSASRGRQAVTRGHLGAVPPECVSCASHGPPWQRLGGREWREPVGLVRSCASQSDTSG